MSRHRRTYRDVLRDLAEDSGGVVSTAEAAGHGVPSVELRKLAARGFLVNVARGVYRVPEVADSDVTPFAEAVRMAGEGAFLSGDAVLALLDLGQVNPRKIHVSGPRRIRRHWPEWVAYSKREAPPEGLTSYDGVPSTPLVVALIESRGSVLPDRLTEAATQAHRDGLLTSGELDRVLTALETA